MKSTYCFLLTTLLLSWVVYSNCGLNAKRRVFPVRCNELLNCCREKRCLLNQCICVRPCIRIRCKYSGSRYMKLFLQ